MLIPIYIYTFQLNFLSANILPPPHDLDLPIVKLMNHPEYLAFQSQIAALSLFPNVYIKFLPPSWDAPTPQTPYPGSPVEEAEVRILKEWKRRIKMYCMLFIPLSSFSYVKTVVHNASIPRNGGVRIPAYHFRIFSFLIVEGSF